MTNIGIFERLEVSSVMIFLIPIGIRFLGLRRKFLYAE
jgi:hypothetical protein